MSSFNDVLAGVKSYFATEDKDFAREVLAKVIESFEATGRDARTAAEQNLVMAAINLVECSSKRRTKAEERLMVELQMTTEYLTGLATPITPIDIETITPAQWSAENPLTLQGAATTALEHFDSATPLDGAVQHLKTVLLNADEISPSDKPLADAAQEFVRAHKAYSLFGDSMLAAAEKLRGVLNPVADPAADEPYLYILMRNDLASMNAGKAVAQGSHAANQMVWEGFRKVDATPAGDQGGLELERLINQWSELATGFGTCIVLGVTEAEMRSTIAAAQAAGLHAGITHDPSYPLWEGKTMLGIPLDTCAYIFAKKGDAKPFVGNFKLMP